MDRIWCTKPRTLLSLVRRMYVLFSISVVSLFALVLAALAIARHVCWRQASTETQHDFAQHLFAAAEDQDSRGPRILPQQNVTDVDANKPRTYAPESVQTKARNQSISSKRF